MKKRTRILSLLLTVLMLLSVSVGCGSSQSGTNDGANTFNDPDTNTEERSYPHTFTDMAGVEITLEKEVETVYIAGSVQPLLAVYRYYRGNSDNLLGCPAASQSIIAGSVFAEIWPDILDLEPHGEDANAEEILALHPDIVFMTGSASGDGYEALVNAGLTVVSFPTAGSGNDNDPFATVANCLSQMAEVFGDSSAADALIRYNTETLESIRAKMSGLA